MRLFFLLFLFFILHLLARSSLAHFVICEFDTFASVTALFSPFKSCPQREPCWNLNVHEGLFWPVITLFLRQCNKFIFTCLRGGNNEQSELRYLQGRHFYFSFQGDQAPYQTITASFSVKAG